jgi:hypothetical protein
VVGIRFLGVWLVFGWLSDFLFVGLWCFGLMAGKFSQQQKNVSALTISALNFTTILLRQLYQPKYKHQSKSKTKKQKGKHVTFKIR